MRLINVFFAQTDPLVSARFKFAPNTRPSAQKSRVKSTSETMNSAISSSAKETHGEPPRWVVSPRSENRSLKAGVEGILGS